MLVVRESGWSMCITNTFGVWLGDNWLFLVGFILFGSFSLQELCLNNLQSAWRRCPSKVQSRLSWSKECSAASQKLFDFTDHIFSSKGWLYFTASPTLPYVEIVHEFYTNISSFYRDLLALSTILQGVEIDLTPDLLFIAFDIFRVPNSDSLYSKPDSPSKSECIKSLLFMRVVLRTLIWPIIFWLKWPILCDC